MSQSPDGDPARHEVPQEDAIPYKRIKHLGIAGVAAGVVLEGVAVATGDAGIGWAGLLLIEGGAAAAVGSHVGEKAESERSQDFE